MGDTAESARAEMSSRPTEAVSLPTRVGRESGLIPEIRSPNRTTEPGEPGHYNRGMSYTALARRYRSTGFDDIVGQEPVARTLKAAIEADRVAHAYLFTGTRGVGKTTMARVFAKALNSSGSAEVDQAIMTGQDTDVIEIDGASNNSVDDARELIAGSVYRPMRGPYKIYIIDEVHMLSTAAFNALLKTMEEPPEHVKFILCTTEAQKVPPTIQSRCQRFDFRAIPMSVIADRLAYVVKNEKLKAEPDGDHYIVNGSKIWTTHAHLADHIFCLVRTDSSGKPQHGISFLLIDMASPGVSVEPIITMAGDHEVNQVFFDNVRVPMANRIGEENKGWSYAKYLLEFERGGGFSAHRIRHELENLRRLISDARRNNPEFDAHGDIDRKVARIEIDLKALEITELRILSAVSGGGNPGPESSIMKLSSTKLEQSINELSVDVLGYTGFVMNPVAEGNPVRADYISSVVPRYLNNRAASIFGGSQEVQRNIIAKMVLGL